jgi:signal transduction histidine kinase/HAMP domain-containing protein
MRRTRALSIRLVIAIGTLAVLQLAVFATLVVALHELRGADRGARTAAHVAMAARTVQDALAKLEATERAIAVEGTTPVLVAAWRADGREVRERVTGLEANGGTGAQQLAAETRAYLQEYAAPFLAWARDSSAPLRRMQYLHRGEPRLEAIRSSLATLAARTDLVRQERRDRASGLAEVAEFVGIGGIVATIACALGLLAYVRRAITTPLGRIADAARSLAGGDLRARVSPAGAVGEVAELVQTFDRMADSLQESRTALERQNAELAEQSVELIEAVRSAREGASVLRAVLDATPDAIALLDRDGSVLVDNPPMGIVRRAFGRDATAIDGHGALVPLDDRDAGVERRDEITLLGTRRSFARYAAPVHDGRGRLIGRLLVLREITAEREAERAKEDFFALVSHELRTPLTAILGYVELVLGDDSETLPEEHARHLAVVERNAQRLLRLVGDLLFAAQVESGSLLLVPGAVDLAQLARDAVELARPRAEDADIALTLEVVPVPPCLGDRDRLAQVLDNLVSNALKFTAPGGRVGVRLTARDGRAQIEVHDTGVGIPEEDIPRLFDRFYRATNATGHTMPGLGLGLMIVRAIVEGHDGTVAVASTVGSGTTITVELPLRPAPAGTTPAPGIERYAAGGR